MLCWKHRQDGGKRTLTKIVTGVIGVVKDPVGRVLFIKQQRGPFAGAWLCPGGKIEPGESAVEAVAREVQEEAGIVIENPRFVGVHEIRGTSGDGGYHFILMCFRADGSGEIPPDFQGDNVDGARWAHFDEIALHSTDLQILTDAGLASFTEAEVAAALAADGITLATYR